MLPCYGKANMSAKVAELSLFICVIVFQTSQARKLIVKVCHCPKGENRINRMIQGYV